MSRRRFLGAIGAAGAAAALPRIAAAEAKGGDVDVIVIGGGFCGITAARECRRAGYRTLVLEARNRLGGRTFTVDFEGRPVDLGGSYVHWFQPYVWSEIRRSGLALLDSTGAVADQLIVHTSAHDIVTLSSEKMAPRIERAVLEYMGDARALLPRPHEPFASDAYLRLDGISSAERLASLKHVDSLMRDILDGNFAGSGHNYSDRFAWLEMVRWYCLAGHNVGDLDDATSRYHFRDGTAALLEFLLREGKPEVRLGTEVRCVVDEGDRVTILTRAGETLAARAVVSAVPLNVLKDGRAHGARCGRTNGRDTSRRCRNPARASSSRAPTGPTAGAASSTARSSRDSWRGAASARC